MNLVKFILYLIYILMVITPVTCQENTYQNLASEEILSLSSHYQENSTTPLQKYYYQSNEYKSEYPFYSYNLALKCRRIVMRRAIDDMVSTDGTEVTINNMSNYLETNDNKLQNKFTILKKSNLTFQSMEWLSLAERDYQESKYYLSISQDHYNYSNQNTTLDALSKANFATYKTNNLLNVVEDKNRLNPEISNTQLSRKGEKVASEWIQVADENLSILSKSGKRRDLVTYCEGNLDIAKEYYSEENYYLATMKAAEIKALTDFGINDEKFETSENAIIYAENQLENANNLLSALRNNQYIDAPIAMVHFETAKIRIEEAKTVESINSFPLADSSIRNSLIAKEQAYAILEYNEAIQSIDKMSEETENEQIPVGIPSFFVVLLTCLVVRRKVT